MIRGIPVPFTQTDHAIWHPNPIGDFTIKSTYYWRALKNKSPVFPQIPWNKLWKLPCPSKIKIFLWQIFEDHLPTAANLYKHHIIPSPLCNLCGEIDDSMTLTTVFLHAQPLNH